jgi:Flp pilus assembly protein TadB
MGEITDAMKNEMRDYGRQEANAFKQSWRYFVAVPIALVVVALLTKAGLPEPLLIPFALVAILALPYAIYRYGQAGGETSGMNMGATSD